MFCFTNHESVTQRSYHSSFTAKGRRSDNPQDGNWIPTLFQHTKAKEIAQMEQNITQKTRYDKLKQARESSRQVECERKG